MTQVVAIRDGHFGGKYRKTGDIFRVDDPKLLSKRWMAEEGSQKYDDFIRAHKIDGKVQKDAITGERIASGGIAEQLAVALEENRLLKARIVELEAEMELMTHKPKAKVSSPTPADEPSDETTDDDKPVRRRRRKE